ncbi:MAG: hypothetical protein IT532_09920 [Burkholderiales bacterium]|nr:hypothetical protein [Burkholderiales bacterium]
MSLKPQDICVLLKLAVFQRGPWSYGQLAMELGMSASEVHVGVRRADSASLMCLNDGWGVPDLHALEEFLVHGLKYAFGPMRGGLTRGVPTAHAAPPLRGLFDAPAGPPPVWPDPDASVEGIGFSPLYKSVPFAAARDARLYELLALADVLRAGECRDPMRVRQRMRARLRASPIETLARRPALDAAKGSKRGTHGKEARLYGRRY